MLEAGAYLMKPMNEKIYIYVCVHVLKENSSLRRYILRHKQWGRVRLYV